LSVGSANTAKGTKHEQTASGDHRHSIAAVGVGLKDGIGFHLFLNIVLTLLVYVPGLLHALWGVLKD
jgi:uncharacterized membrane protein YqaE (UPF0057 family)